MILLIDHDEVLCQFVKRCVELLNGHLKMDVDPRDVRSFTLTDAFGIDQETGDRLLGEFMNRLDFYDGVEPMLGAIEGMHALIEDGHDVFVATTIAKHAPKLYEQKFAWIKRHLPFFDMNRFVGIHEKWLLDGDVLLDDGTHNLRPFEEQRSRYRRAVAFDRPWNQDWDGPRVSSWQEFVERIRRVDRALSELD